MTEPKNEIHDTLSNAGFQYIPGSDIWMNGEAIIDFKNEMLCFTLPYSEVIHGEGENIVEMINNTKTNLRKSYYYHKKLLKIFSTRLKIENNDKEDQ